MVKLREFSPEVHKALMETVKLDFSPMKRMMDELHSKWNDRLMQHLMDQLKLRGFEFSNKQELLSFMKARVFLISQDGSDKKYFYLDYVDQDNMGTLLGFYNTAVNIKQDGDRFIATMG